MSDETIETGNSTSVENNVDENVVDTTETPEAVEASAPVVEDLTIDDLLNLGADADPLFTDDANHRGMKPLHEWVGHLPEDVRKHVANLRSSYTRKTQEIANLRKELEQERLELQNQREATLNNPAYNRAVEVADNPEEFDLYDPEGMKKEIERQAAIQLKQMLAPAREELLMKQRRMELDSFKSQHPEITNDEYRLPIAKMLTERPELRLEDAYYIVRAKVDAEKSSVLKAELEAERASRRSALMRTASGTATKPNGTPKFRNAWEAYQYHKAQKQGI
jgi:hypothetical protein